MARCGTWGTAVQGLGGAGRTWLWPKSEPTCCPPPEVMTGLHPPVGCRGTWLCPALGSALSHGCHLFSCPSPGRERDCGPCSGLGACWPACPPGILLLFWTPRQRCMGLHSWAEPQPVPVRGHHVEALAARLL